NVRRAIQRAEDGAGRVRGSGELLAVTKSRGIDDITQAIATGCVHFAESYVQEAVEKIQAIEDPSLIWHFIGPIQSNKTQLIARHFDWVHSVDRFKVAERLNRQRSTDKRPLQVCIQVNITGEVSKSGVSAGELTNLLQQMRPLKHLQVRGLMTVPRKSDSIDLQRQCFLQLNALLRQVNQQGARLDSLSMGMSGDYLLAIEQGASMVRLGSAIFGRRK
ncbi:MAG: YggS family pyridoxal phosphate-dependent enzyme, partial [Thiohalomonadales bacterium]